MGGLGAIDGLISVAALADERVIGRQLGGRVGLLLGLRDVIAPMVNL